VLASPFVVRLASPLRSPSHSPHSYRVGRTLLLFKLYAFNNYSVIHYSNIPLRRIGPDSENSVIKKNEGIPPHFRIYIIFVGSQKDILRFCIEYFTEVYCVFVVFFSCLSFLFCVFVLRLCSPSPVCVPEFAPLFCTIEQSLEQRNQKFINEEQIVGQSIFRLSVSLLLECRTIEINFAGS
jgi:hypothetical protein